MKARTWKILIAAEVVVLFLAVILVFPSNMYTKEAFDSKYEKLYSEKEVFFAQKEALFTFDEIKSAFPACYIDVGGATQKKDIDFKMRAPVMFGGNIPELAKSIKERIKADWRIVLCVGGKAESLSKALMDFDIIAPVEGIRSAVDCSFDRMPHGCEFPDEKVLFLGEGDIYTAVKKSAASKEKRYAEKSDEELGHSIRWLVPNAQKNDMEPILMTLEPGGTSEPDDPHSGEEFGYVLSGSLILHMGPQRLKLKKGDSFYFSSDAVHSLENTGKTQAQVLGVSCPPSF